MSVTSAWKDMMKNEKLVQTYKSSEKASAPFVETLLQQSGIVSEANDFPDKTLVVLDLGCGTGIVSSLLNKQVRNNNVAMKITCCDITDAMLAYTEHRSQEEGWQNAEFKHVDAQKTGLPSDTFTHIFAALVFLGLPDSLAALDENLRILQPGGTLGFTTWVDVPWLLVVRAALDTISPDLRFPTSELFLSSIGSGNWRSVTWIESQLQERKMIDINVQAHTKTVAIEAAGFVNMTMMIVPNIIKRAWSEEQVKEYEEKIRPALAEYLEGRFGKDGDVVLQWEAIVATARKSSS
ncbi:S-adenosyl-L-methionine-dependent methyltransferase [Aspergillus karnatakaensis]|uniref:class I SAM-dependent methyltransferase n=1 Tax=Aspergillus karnatakaensis TaxID=1810916 RepID=UPI003CCD502C